LSAVTLNKQQNEANPLVSDAQVSHAAEVLLKMSPVPQL